MVTSYFGSLKDINSKKNEEYLNFRGINSFLIEINDDEIKNLELGETYYQTFYRKTIISDNDMEIKKTLQKYRKKYHIIAGVPLNAKTAALLARDNRVDMIRINPSLGLSVFNKRYANRVLENGKILEIDLSNFQNKYFANKVRPLMRILKSMKVQKLSFHLTNLPTNIEELRSDKALIAVGRLLEISGNSAATSIISDRIKQNMKKIEGKIPFPGVELDGS